MLLDTLVASLLRNILAGKGINRAGEEIVRAGYGKEKVRKATKKDKIIKKNGIFNAVLSFN